MVTKAAAGVRLAARMDGLAPSAIGAALRLGDRSDVISLAGGLPAAEGFSLVDVRAALEDVLAAGAVALQYGDTNGLPELREWIAAQLGAEYGMRAGADDVIVTHGSQQGIDLVCKALLDPGDVVVVDRPSYIGAIQVFRLFQADLRAMPLAEDGDLDRLRDALAGGLRPRLLYVVPNFANPTGATLTAHQREVLAELAERYGFLIVEDDPYSEIWLGTDQPDTRPIASLTDQAVRLGSFSKMLFPGCRVGYLSAWPDLVGRLRLVRQAADLGNSDLLQRLAHRLVIHAGDLRARLADVRALYRQRRDALVVALTHRLGDRLRFQVPAGGFFVWARLDGGLSASRLLPVAVRHGVSFVPGAPFFVDDTDADAAALRLAFSALPFDCADEAASRLAAACREVCFQPSMGKGKGW